MCAYVYLYISNSTLAPTLKNNVKGMCSLTTVYISHFENPLNFLPLEKYSIFGVYRYRYTYIIQKFSNDNKVMKHVLSIVYDIVFFFCCAALLYRNVFCIPILYISHPFSINKAFIIFVDQNNMKVNVCKRGYEKIITSSPYILYTFSNTEFNQYCLINTDYADEYKNRTCKNGMSYKQFKSNFNLYILQFTCYSEIIMEATIAIKGYNHEILY